MAAVANAIITIEGQRRFAYLSAAHSYGDPTKIVATTTADGLQHLISVGSEERLPGVILMPSAKMPVIDYVVTEPYEWQRYAETASNYDLFEIQPGAYRVEWVNEFHDPVIAGQTARIGKYTVHAIHTRSYYVSSAFGRTLGIKDESPMTPTMLVRDQYSFAMNPAENPSYVMVAPAQDEVMPDTADGHIVYRRGYHPTFAWDVRHGSHGRTELLNRQGEVIDTIYQGIEYVESWSAAAANLVKG